MALLGPLKNGVLMLVCCLASLIKNVNLARTSSQMEVEMMRSRVIPDVIRIAPRHEVTVRFKNSTVDFGNKINPLEMRLPPTVMHWPTDTNALYTIVFTDPDVPSRLHPDDREYMHWIVANIPKNDVERGDCLAQYIGGITAHLGSWHRYVFIVFKQRGKEEFKDWVHIDNRPIRKRRVKFSTTHFASKYNLGDPIAANYFVSSNETLITTTPYVPTTIELRIG